MTRRQKKLLWVLSEREREELAGISRSRSAPATLVARAKALLAVADGASYTQANQQAGRRSGDAVVRLVQRFNAEGLDGLEPRHGGGPSLVYGEAERERILAKVQRVPNRSQDGTATWSLIDLQRALRTAPDGLPQVSTYTILSGLHEAGWSWQQARSWCDTGTVLRQRKAGVVTVTDPASDEKKADRAGVSTRRTDGYCGPG
jgi:transposase